MWPRLRSISELGNGLLQTHQGPGMRARARTSTWNGKEATAPAQINGKATFNTAKDRGLQRAFLRIGLFPDGPKLSSATRHLTGVTASPRRVFNLTQEHFPTSSPTSTFGASPGSANSFTRRGLPSCSDVGNACPLAIAITLALTTEALCGRVHFKASSRSCFEGLPLVLANVA